MNKTLIAVVLCLSVGCTSRSDKARTSADVWHIGHAMEVKATELPPKTIQIMGATLKQIADRWAKDLGYEIDKGIE